MNSRFIFFTAKRRFRSVLWRATDALFIAILLALILHILVHVSVATSPLLAQALVPYKWYGVNRSGGEFSPEKIPGIPGTDFVYPDNADLMRTFTERGLILLRLPFIWERLQPEALGPLDPETVRQIKKTLDSAKDAKAQVLLDLHNYGRYHKKALIASDGKLLGDVWSKLLLEVQNHPALFGAEIMNEPHDLVGGPDTWKQIAQDTVTIMRERGVSTRLVIPGYGWQSARYWQDNNAGLTIADPDENMVYSAHQYFDKSGTGIYDEVELSMLLPGKAGELLKPFTDWLEKNKATGIITEFGVPKTDMAWLPVLDEFLTVVDTNPRLLGAVYWSSGPWWGDYPLSVEPDNSPQTVSILKVLSQFPSRSNPVTLPKFVKPGQTVKFKNQPTIYLVDKNGLLPFATWSGYKAYRATHANSRLVMLLDKAENYTIRWVEAELGFISNFR